MLLMNLLNWTSPNVSVFDFRSLVILTGTISIGSPEVGDLVSAIAGIYSPELVVGYTPVCLPLNELCEYYSQWFIGLLQ